MMPYQFSVNYWRNNKQFLTFLSFIIIVNIVLFVTRAYYFRDFSMLSGARPNPFYMISRANGKYIVVMLRLTIKYTCFVMYVWR